MYQQIPTKFSVTAQIPRSTLTKASELKEIRDACDHIDERAFGKASIKGKPNADAISIFDQKDITRGILRYAAHSLDLLSEMLNQGAAIYG